MTPTRWLFIVTLGLGFLVQPAAAGATQSTLLPLPLQADFAFDLPGVVRGTLHLSGASYWYAHWAAEPSAPLDASAFRLEAARVTASYHVRTLLPGEVDDALHPKIQPAVPDHLNDAVVQLAHAAGPQEIMAAGWGDRSPRIDAWETSDWNLTTAPTGTAVGQQPYAQQFSQTGYLGEPNVLLQGSPQRVTAFVDQVYLYGFNVTIVHADGEPKTYRTGVWSELVTPLQEVQREGLLILSSNPAVEQSQIQVEDMAGPVRLFAPRLAYEGNLGFPQSSGRLSLDNASRILDHEEVTLRGDFIVEAQEPTSTHHAVGVTGRAWTTAGDERAAPRGPSIEPALVGVAGVGIAGLVAVAAWLFTRLQRPRLLDQGNRGRIHESIQANPGITVEEIAIKVQTTTNNARYHLGVLRRHGLVRSFEAMGAECFVLATEHVDAPRRQLVLERDAKVAQLLRVLDADGTWAHEAVKRLSSSIGLSRASGWDVVERAVQAKLIERERLGRRVRLKPLVTLPTPAVAAGPTPPGSASPP